jgi:hypothetical protein
MLAIGHLCGHKALADEEEEEEEEVKERSNPTDSDAADDDAVEVATGRDESTPCPVARPGVGGRQDHGHGHDHDRARRHHHHHRGRDGPPALPYGAAAVPGRKAGPFENADVMAVFELYLAVKEGLDPGRLDGEDHERRWRRFARKWNAGALEKAWYRADALDAATGIRIEGRRERGAELAAALVTERRGGEDARKAAVKEGEMVEGEQAGDDDDDNDDDDYGPAPPPPPPAAGAQGAQGAKSRAAAGRYGAGVPTLQDLQARQELAVDEAQDRMGELRQARKADRALQKERLDELVPRAEAGTRERQLEKKKLVNEKMRGFRDRSPGAAEVGDAELMGGGGEDETAEYKKMVAAQQRKKTERELRREEIERARKAEWEERRAELREKEEEKMEAFRALARQQFG